jgi:putative phosphoesterase
MKLAVISDTHDHIKKTDLAVGQINDSKADILIHCGDLVSPFMLDSLSVFRGPVHIVFGNNEGDKFTISSFAKKYPSLTLHGDMGSLKTEYGDIAFTHKPVFARALASEKRYTAVFYGHSHRHKVEQIDKTLLINPGDIMGLHEVPGWVLYKVEEGEWERFTLD